uniref:Uncharacterized protein n=1 Tax=Anguilla anguilla TaxID=7936 RepID=A0A0E9TAD0_ANGAN
MTVCTCPILNYHEKTPSATESHKSCVHTTSTFQEENVISKIKNSCQQ